MGRELDRAFQARFPGISREQHKRVLEALQDHIDAEHKEAERRYTLAKQKGEEVEVIFAGLPTTIGLEDACRLKAKREGREGELARKWLAEMNSPAHLLATALEVRAMELHPSFGRDPGKQGTWCWTGSGPMLETDALLDWFQMTHPKEASRIEAQFGISLPEAMMRERSMPFLDLR
jgi:hypothetical protein